MSLRGKLLLAQLPLAFSLLVVAVVSRRTVTALDHNAQEILQDNYQSVLAAQRMRDSADALGRAALAKALGHDVDDPVARASFAHELQFQEGNITEPGEREMTARVRADWDRFSASQQHLQEVLAEARLGAYLAELQPALLALERSTAEIVTINQKAMVAKSERARERAERMSGVMMAVTVAAFLLGLLSSLYLTNRLTRPLSVLAQAVRRLGQGDLDARARLPGKDEVAEVANELNTMAARLGEYRSSSLGELLQAQQSSQAAIDSLPDPVLVFQLGGGLLSANRASATLFGVDTDTVGEAMLSALPSEVRRSVDKMRQHIAAGKGAYVPKGLEEAIPVPLRDGTQYFLARANPVVGEQGQVTGLTLLFQDVTRLRRFDELKTDLVATVAHEFRTPLTSLRMAIHLCVAGAAGELTDKQAELLFAARDDCERLQALVDDILDLSRIQSGRIELHPRVVGATSLIVAAVDEHAQLARDRGIELRIDATSVDRQVSADPERMDLVLSNLLSNAIRHTPTGGTIEVRALIEADAVRFEITDSGAGIAQEHLPRLFERFYRVPGTPKGGVGLGLFICKEIVEAHNGRIGVNSTPEGTTFWFLLPPPAGQTNPVAPTVTRQ